MSKLNLKQTSPTHISVSGSASLSASDIERLIRGLMQVRSALNPPAERELKQPAFTLLQGELMLTFDSDTGQVILGVFSPGFGWMLLPLKREQADTLARAVTEVTAKADAWMNVVANKPN